MEISDIIKKEADRIFIVDPECFIIFTGDSTDDSRPFIRIGNWLDLPIEIIPLIENIIISDLLVGNPAHEQFNIDIHYLQSNRYIGNKLIANRFLDFQQIFGLDLHNAAIVDAGKDIPKISKSKIISGNSEFLGIFYNDGNFKINHREKTIFDLKNILKKTQNNYTANEILSNNAKTSNRYGNAGVIFLENNPLFYKNNDFVSYLFAGDYYKNFLRLKINPRNINTVLQPSSNFLSLTKFIKWRHLIKSKLKIFCDFDQQIEFFKKLFKDTTLVREDFTGMSFPTSTGVQITAYPNSYNLKLKFQLSGKNSAKLKIAYLKGISNIKTIIKDKLDGLFLNYSVYEDSNLFLINYPNPVAIIDDGNPNLKKLAKFDKVILYQNIQYDFVKFEDAVNFIDLCNNLIDDPSFINKLFDNNISEFAPFFEKIKKGKNKSSFIIKCINTITLLKYFYHSTNDRKFAASIKSILQQYSHIVNIKLLNKTSTPCKVNLIFINNHIYCLAEKLKNEKSSSDYLPDDVIDIKNIDKIASAQTRKIYEKIETDRQRLLKLLALYYKKLKGSKEINELKAAIKQRKELYKEHLLPEKDPDLSKKSRKKNKKLEEHFSEISQSLGDKRLAASSRRTSDQDIEANKKKIFKILGIIIIIALLSLISFFSYKYYKEYLKKKDQQIAEEKLKKDKALQQAIADKKEQVIKKYNIRISNLDIFNYANKIAIKNGYSPLPKKSFGKKDPNWIFPGNIFYLPDNTKITIIKGDTLWDIANQKLMVTYIKFYEAIDEMKKNLKKEQPISDKIMEKAKKNIFNNKQKRILNEIKKIYKK